MPSSRLYGRTVLNPVSPEVLTNHLHRAGSRGCPGAGRGSVGWHTHVPGLILIAVKCSSQGDRLDLIQPEDVKQGLSEQGLRAGDGLLWPPAGGFDTCILGRRRSKPQ